MDEFVEAVVSEVEYEQTAWVAALDIAKASAMVCTRLPVGSGSGRKAQRVWQVGASTSAVLELAGHLVCQGVELVVMESASVLEAVLLPPGGQWSACLVGQREGCEERARAAQGRQARRGMAGEAG